MLPVKIVEPNLNEDDIPEEDTFHLYLEQLLATHDLKLKIHFFDKETTSMHVIQFYNKWVCIDNQAASAVRLGKTIALNGKKENVLDLRLKIAMCCTHLKKKKRNVVMMNGIKRLLTI